MNDCIFCKIINKELPSYTIYEDDILKVFMNINPSTNGHLLLIPKKHLVTILDIDKDFLAHALDVIQTKIYPLLKEKLHCEGLTLSQNNFYGQEVKHFHLHLTPRYKDDMVDYQYNEEVLKNVEDVYKVLVDD